MKKETIRLLKQKGWSEEDVKKAEKIIESRRMIDKSRTHVYSNRVIYWTIIAVMVLCNFIISLLFVPFLLVLNRLAMNVIIVIIGFAFGSLFTLLILDVEYVSKTQHFIGGIIIPVLALINISLMTNITNSLKYSS